MSTTGKVVLLAGLGGALLVGALAGLWFLLAPDERPGTRELRRLGCGDRSYVSLPVPKDGDPDADVVAGIECDVDESVTPPSCGAVLTAYLAAPGHRVGNVRIRVEQARVVAGKRASRPTCEQVLAPSGAVVSSRY
ncbi:MAG TPA: hypothetical protein VHS09_04480 [Polyangiaceae bacterium]|nr:hypothetical protein [Polyangiaceae bacterium]